MRKLLWILTLVADGGWAATYVVTSAEAEIAEVLVLLALNGIMASAELIGRVKTNGHGGGQGHLHG